jgi:TatD DNase family protein
MWFDSHLHFDRFAVQQRVEVILDRAVDAGVSKYLAVGGSPEANKRSQALAEAYPGRIYASAGYDRDLADEQYDAAELEAQVSHPLVRAVGETGLDYFHTQDNKEAQQALFELNLSLALSYQKPVIVHSRAADEETISMLRAYADQQGQKKGVLHCFTLDKSCAMRLLDLGFMISFSGIVTFANAQEIREVVSYIPDNRLLVETDAPYLAPVPERGKENQPAYLIHTGAILAKLRGVSEEVLASQTMANAMFLFGETEEEYI